MAYGLEIYNAAGAKTFTTNEFHLLVVDMFGTRSATTVTKSYPSLTGYTIGVIDFNPYFWTITITYPSGVPTVTITADNTGTVYNGLGGLFCDVVVYIAAGAMPSGYGLWTYDIDGKPTVINTELPSYCYSGALSITNVGAASFTQSCSLLQPIYGADVWIPPGYTAYVNSTDADSLVLFDVPNSTTQSVAMATARTGTYAYCSIVASQNCYDSTVVTPVVREFRKLGTWHTEPGGYGMKLFNAAGTRVYSTGANPLRIMSPGLISVGKSVSSSWTQNAFLDPGGGTWTNGSTLPSDLMCISNTHTVVAYGYCDPFKGEKGNTIAGMASMGWQKYDSTTLKVKITNPGPTDVGMRSAGIGGGNSPGPAYAFSGATVKALFIDRSLYV